MPDPNRTEGPIRRRTTGDLLVLLIAGTVCFAVTAAGAGLFIVTVVHPDRDTTSGFHAISDVINTLIGLLAGFLAGRTDANLTREARRGGLTERDHL